jgi:phage tail-like protein
MSLTQYNPLSSRHGYDQGRIRPKYVTPINGDWVWCFGSDTPGRIATLKTGDGVSIRQNIDLTGIDRIVCTSQARFPATIGGPIWMGWIQFVGVGAVAGLVTGDEFAAGAAGRYREGVITEYQAPAYRITGAVDLDLIFLIDSFSGATDPVDVELPALYLEKVETATATQPWIFGRVPFPDGVCGRRGPVRFMLADPGLLGWNLSTLTVTVAGEPIMVNGVVQSGWAGDLIAGSTATVLMPSPGPGAAVNDLLYFSAHRLADLASSLETSVNVSIERNGGGPAYEFKWDLTVEDHQPPQLLSAGARDLRVVRAVFDEPVRLLGDGDPGDGLTVANWSVERVPDGLFPVAEVGVESAIWADDDAVDIVTTVPMSPGRDYLVKAQNIEDIAGNAIPAGTEVAPFEAIDLPVPSGRSFEIWEMLPAMNRRRDDTGDLLKFIRCLQEVLGLAMYDLDRFPNVYDYKVAGQPWLDAMLSDLGNPFWVFDDLTDLEKRRLISVLVTIYKQKGTEVGIENAIRFFLGIDVDVRVPTQEGWILTDEVEGTSVISGSTAPFPLWDGAELTVIVDGGAEQTVTFNSGDFVDISQATAEEVAAVIQAALDAAVTSDLETFDLDDGDTLTVQVDGGADQLVTFVTGDFVDIDNATAAEVATKIDATIAGGTALDDGGRVRVESDTTGPGATVQITGGTAREKLGFPSDSVSDGRGDPDGDAVVISTYGTGPIAGIEVTGGDANSVLNFPTDPVIGLGYELGVNTYLAPSGTFLLYSFVIDSPVALTPEQYERIVFIANYMKPAHTHLIEVVEPGATVDPDHVELGLSRLGVNWDLH